MRRFFSLLALMVGGAMVLSACTLPDSADGRTASTYPGLVNTKQTGTPMLRDTHSAEENILGSNKPN